MIDWPNVNSFLKDLSHAGKDHFGKSVFKVKRIISNRCAEDFADKTVL